MGRSLLWLALVTLFSRLPFLLPGYGSDSDAWLLANTARAIAESGRYTASRLPGYPVHEGVSALLWQGGPLALNGATTVASVVATLCFGLALRTLGVRNWSWWALAMAFTPVVFINSVVAMDYVWALAGTMAALWQVLRRQPVLAGVALGLAIGCRITTGAMLLPLALLLCAGVGKHRWRSLASFAAAAGLIGAACFVPVVLTHGRGFFMYYDSGYPPWGDIMVRATHEVWGTMGLLSVAIGLVLAARSACVPGPVPPWCLSAAAGIVLALYGWAYLRLPYEAGYLIPLVPWVLLFISTRVPQPRHGALCLALCISPFALYLRTDPKASDAVWQALKGPAQRETERRQRWGRNTQRLLAAAREKRGPGVVISGAWLARVENAAGSAQVGRTGFVYLLSAREVRRRQGDGETVFYAPYQRSYWLDGQFVELPALGGKPLLRDLP